MRLFLLVWLAVSGLALFSCGKPKQCILPDDQLVRVLADIQIAESAAQSLISPVKDSVLEAYYQQIYEIHGVEESQFRECYAELQANPDRMNALFEQVFEELGRLDAKSNNEK